MVIFKHLVWIGVLAAVAWAQFPTSKADLVQEATKRLDVIAKKLNLNPDQIEKIKPLLNQQMQDAASAREKFAASDRSDTAKKEAMDSIKASREQNGKEIKQILTPEQAGKWDGMVKGWKDEMNFKMPKP